MIRGLYKFWFCCRTSNVFLRISKRDNSNKLNESNNLNRIIKLGNSKLYSEYKTSNYIQKILLNFVSFNDNLLNISCFFFEYTFFLFLFLSLYQIKCFLFLFSLILVFNFCCSEIRMGNLNIHSIQYLIMSSSVKSTESTARRFRSVVLQRNAFRELVSISQLRISSPSSCSKRTWL